MHLAAQVAALEAAAVLGFLPMVGAVPMADELPTVRTTAVLTTPTATSSSVNTSGYDPVYGSDSYLPYSYASTSSLSSISVELPTSSAGSIQWDAVSSASSLPPSVSVATTARTAGVTGTLPAFTVVTETFTIPLGPSSTICSGSASVPSAEPTLSSVLATFTIPYGNSSTTLLHTFTYTPGPSSLTPAYPTTSASLSHLPPQSLSVMSDSSASVASAESIFKSILSHLGTGTLASQSLHTFPATETAKKDPLSEVTASFTLTVPTAKPKEKTTLESFRPTFTGPLITASFTLTLPPRPSTKTTETAKTSKTADTSCTTSTSWTKHTTHTWPETRTFSLSTKVTLTLSPHTPTGTTGTGTAASTWSPIPSGTDAITLTYTLPAGAGRTSQVVTITTLRPVGPAGTGTASASDYYGSGVGTVGTTSAIGTIGTAPTSTEYPRSSLSWSFSRNSSVYQSTGSIFSFGTGTAFTVLPTGAMPDLPSVSKSQSTSITTATATATATRVSVVTLTRTHIQTDAAFVLPASNLLEEPTVFFTIARRAAPTPVSSSYYSSFSSYPSSYSSSRSSSYSSSYSSDDPFPVFTITWPSESSSSSWASASSSASSSNIASVSASASANSTSNISSSHASSSSASTSAISSFITSSTYSSIFGRVIASPTPTARLSRNTRKDRRAPACNDNNVVINFDGGTVPTPSDMNDPGREMHFGTGFSRLINKWGDTFIASSKPGLLRFVPNRFGGATTGAIKPASACMRFNLNSFTIGCSTMYAECRVYVKGVRNTAGVDETVATQTITVPKVQQLVNNDMQLITLEPTMFANLTSVEVGIEVNGPPFPSWFMDDLSVDLLCSNSCPTRRSVKGNGEAHSQDRGGKSIVENGNRSVKNVADGGDNRSVKDSHGRSVKEVVKDSHDPSVKDTPNRSVKDAVDDESRSVKGEGHDDQGSVKKGPKLSN